MEKILGKFNELRFFHGESDNYAESGMLAILEYRGATPYMFFFKHGLVGEQLVRTTKCTTAPSNYSNF